MTQPPNPEPKPLAADVDERPLVDYIISEVNTGLAGRDGEEIVNAPPIRTVFAGVIEPARERSASSFGPAGASAIGLDFRVRRANSSTPLKLTVEATWAHYFAVYPTWAQLLGEKSMEQLLAPENRAPARPPATAVVLDGAGLDGQAEDAAESDATADDDPPPQKPNSGDALRLPRVFRRVNASLPPLTFDIAEIPGDKDVAVQELAKVIESVRSEISSHPRAWRHLDDPEKNERQLASSQPIVTAESYALAVSGVKGSRVTQPSWRVRIRADVALDPVLEGVIRVRVLLENATPFREEKRPVVEGARPDLVEPDQLLQERSLFDTHLSVTVENAEVVPFRFLLAPSDYRNTPEMVGKGINCIAVQSPTTPAAAANRIATGLSAAPLSNERLHGSSVSRSQGRRVLPSASEDR